jgi:hypothetical protein
MRGPKTRHRDAGTGEFVSRAFARANPRTTVSERGRQPPSGDLEITFKKGDRVEHPSIGKGTVTSGRLGPKGELKVRPDEPHHSGRRIVEVMARRTAKLEKE